MSYKNWKLHISQLPRKQQEYLEAVRWCMNNNEYTIIQKNDFYCVVEKPELPALTKEQIAVKRAAYRKEVIDNKTLERMRKIANNTWTEEDEKAYLELDAQVTKWIEENLPYPEETYHELLV